MKKNRQKINCPLFLNGYQYRKAIDTGETGLHEDICPVGQDGSPARQEFFLTLLFFFSGGYIHHTITTFRFHISDETSVSFR